jgi:hypothetical protein
LPLQTLRLTYNAAHAAYQSCAAAINETLLSGRAPTQQLLDEEALALHELNDARDRLLFAMQGTADWHPSD